jgi:hypothetical protein
MARGSAISTRTPVTIGSERKFREAVRLTGMTLFQRQHAIAFLETRSITAVRIDLPPNRDVSPMAVVSRLRRAAKKKLPEHIRNTNRLMRRPAK